MRSGLTRIIFLLWPPFEVWAADRVLKKQNREKDVQSSWQTLVDQIRASIPDDTDYVEVEKAAKQIEDAEAKRKDTLETKASSFLSGVGIALSIIGLIAGLFVSQQPHGPWSVIIGILYLLAIVCLLVTAHYAVKARRVSAFATLTTDGLLDSVKTKQWKIQDRVILILGHVKWNEAELIRKSNYLSVAEALFLRALFLLALAILGNVVLRILNY